MTYYFNRFHYLIMNINWKSIVTCRIRNPTIWSYVSLFIFHRVIILLINCVLHKRTILYQTVVEMVSWDKKYHIEVRKSIAILAFLLSLCIIHGTDTSLLQYSISFLFKNDRTHILIFTKIEMLFFNTY